MPKFQAIKFTQRPGAPEMYLAAIKANEILKWADAPRSSADLMALYQRALDPKRQVPLTDFIQQSEMNIVPGAVIIALRSDTLKVVDVEGQAVLLEVESPPFDRATEMSRAIDELQSRMTHDERKAMTRLASDPDEEASELAEIGIESSDDDSGIPDSYLTLVGAELLTAQANWDSQGEERRQAIEQYLYSASRPGLIIDGQHRVYAAKDVDDFDVILPVVLVAGLPIGEQVFHFYVLNNKAKPLSKTELRRTVSTALTNKEIDALWDRFEEAGIDPDKVRLTHRVNTDAQSPFAGLLDFGFGSGFIKENVAFQVVDKFVSMPRKYRALSVGVPAWESGSKDDRLPTFYTFWSAIKERYPEAWAEGVKNGHGQIFMKVSLIVLQEYVLDNLLTLNNVLRKRNEAPPFSDSASLREGISAILEDLPENFFQKEWMEKQIDTTAGQKYLRNSIQAAVDAGGKNLGNMHLFKPRS